MGIPDLLTCLLRNLYPCQEATVTTGLGTMDWFQIGKGVRQGCILSPCLFNLYAEYIMWNSRLDEAQAGIKIARRNINNLRGVGTSYRFQDEMQVDQNSMSIWSNSAPPEQMIQRGKLEEAGPGDDPIWVISHVVPYAGRVITFVFKILRSWGYIERPLMNSSHKPDCILKYKMPFVSWFSWSTRGEK